MEADLQARHEKELAAVSGVALALGWDAPKTLKALCRCHFRRACRPRSQLLPKAAQRQPQIVQHPVLLLSTATLQWPTLLPLLVMLATKQSVQQNPLVCLYSAAASSPQTGQSLKSLHPLLSIFIHLHLGKEARKSKTLLRREKKDQQARERNRRIQEAEPELGSTRQEVGLGVPVHRS